MTASHHRMGRAWTGPMDRASVQTGAASPDTKLGRSTGRDHPGLDMCRLTPASPSDRWATPGRQKQATKRPCPPGESGRQAGGFFSKLFGSRRRSGPRASRTAELLLKGVGALTMWPLPVKAHPVCDQT
jgi:hypothetical protein